jgi:hypothetical protein
MAIIMQDATNIKDFRFEIDGVPTIATDTWITEFGDIYITLKHPKGGFMNVDAKHIRKYIRQDNEVNAE